VISKGSKHPTKIELVYQINFLEILDHFQFKHTTLDIETVDEPEILHQEQFYHIMAGAINRLGIWCLELYQNEQTLLG